MNFEIKDMQLPLRRFLQLALPLLVVQHLALACAPAAAVDVGSHYGAGVADYNKGSYKTALQHFQASLAQGNGSAANYIYMGNSYAALGNKQQAVRMYNQILKSFKGTPAAATAEKYIQKLDPKGLYAEPAAAGTQAAGMITAPNTPLRVNDPNRPRGPALINRINVLPPKIAGHPPVNPGTVSAVRSLLSRLPSSAYALLEETGVNINIAPNFTDKWPEKGGQSKPGMEHLTYAQDYGFTEGTDVFIFERAAEDVYGKELGDPIDPETLKDELFCQFGHAINSYLGLSNQTDFIAQYDLDKGALLPPDKRRQTLFLQPDGKGAIEVCATAIGVTLGAGPYNNLDKHFKKSRDWVQTRMEQEYRNRLGVSARNPRPTSANKGSTARGGAPKTAMVTPAPGTTEKPVEATLEMPSQEHIPYTRHSGDHLYVHGSINGKPTEILLDTGAFKVVIGKQDLVALGIKPPDGPAEIVGSGAAGALRGWEMPLEISIGRIKRKLPVQVIDGRQPMLLGQPFLSGMHYQIDRGRSYIRFIRDAKDVEKEISYNSVAIPFRMLNGNMMVEAKINGVKTEMNFDTGAPYTLLTAMSIYEFGLHPVGPIQVRGAGGSASSGYECYADTVELGAIRKTGVHVAVGSNVGHNVLGQDFFGRMKFIVDNEKHVIRIAQ
jgi:clan AA aspartic protease (TIGR02281 family)